VQDSQRDQLVAQLAALRDLVEWLTVQPPTPKYDLAIELLEQARWRAEQALAKEWERRGEE